MCAVAASEAVDSHWHLLAFELRRYAADKHYGLYALKAIDGLCIVDGVFLADIKLHVGSPCLHGVIGEFNGILLSLLHVEFKTHGLVAPCTVGGEHTVVYLKCKSARILHANHCLSVLQRSEDGLVLGREVFHTHALCEGVLTACGDGDGIGVILCHDRFSRARRIVPECALHAFLSVRRALWQKALYHHLFGEVATLEIYHIFLSCLCFYSVKNGDGGVWRSIIVSPHHRDIVGIGTDDGNLLFLGKWQNRCW